MEISCWFVLGLHGYRLFVVGEPENLVSKKQQANTEPEPCPQSLDDQQTYVGEGGVREEREALEQVLVVIVLDHRRPVGLQHKLTGVTKAPDMLSAWLATC